MSLGLPGHLASRVLSDGLTRGAHAIAAMCLAGALAIYALVRAAVAPEFSASVFGCIVALGVGLAFLEWRRSWGTALGYILVGAVSVAVGTMAAQSFPVGFVPAVTHVVDLMWVATVMVGSVGNGRALGQLWGLLGYLGGTAGAIVGSIWAGEEPRFAPVPLGAALLVLVGVFVLSANGGRRLEVVQPLFRRAARDEKIAEVRSDVEMRAAALIHDTVLGSLTAIAERAPGPVSPTLSRAIERDLDAILRQDWAAGVTPATPEELDSSLRTVVDEVRELGLAVEVTGDTESVQRLSPERVAVLSAALRQLLVNVHRHAGVDSAEVIVTDHSDSVAVMVIDGGVGFVPETIPSDRIGVRGSVVARVEAVGGSVRIWSTVGRGTSVLVTIPSLETKVLAPEAVPSGDELFGGLADSDTSGKAIHDGALSLPEQHAVLRTAPAADLSGGVTS